MASTEPVRVLVVDHVGAFWGAEQYLLQIAPGLAQHGVELILTTPSETAFARAWSAHGLSHRDLRALPHRGLRRDDGSGRRPSATALAREATTVARSALGLRRAARDVDVIHSNSMAAHVEVALAGRLANRPTVLDVHDIVVPGLGRRILGTAARVASVSIAWSHASAATVGGLARDDVELIPPGIDVRRFSPGPPSDSLRRELGGDATLLIGIIGRIDPIKRIDVAVRAMAATAARRHGARLVVIGATHRGGESYADQVRREAEEILGDAVVFAGARTDMPEVLRALDIVVSTNAAEPFGLSVLEAQASEVAVIASRGGGIPDFVIDDETGVLVEPLDVRDLADAIDRLAADPAARRRLGAAGRRQAVERFDLDRQVARRAAVYRRAAGRAEPVTGGG